MRFFQGIIAFGLVLLFCMVGCQSKKTRFVTIGTGGVTGLYYPTGGAISRMLNKKFKQFKIKATVESTSGSVFNINAVIKGDMEFGIAQSDIQGACRVGGDRGSEGVEVCICAPCRTHYAGGIRAEWY
jgi:TRAP transporter TAXI family solute receptor